MTSKIDSNGQNPAYEYGYFKILIPAFNVGAVIGPKGDNITSLQETTKTIIEISKADDCYPGTMERVCLISGHKEAILKALVVIMKVMVSKQFPDPTPCIDYDRKVAYERGKQVKILLPNKTVSKIIGSCGKTIKDIKVKSGSFVQISQIYPGITVYERCVTVMGEIENNSSACRMILDRVIGDNIMARFLNVSYAHITHCVPNSNPVGSPVAETRKIHDIPKINGTDDKVQTAKNEIADSKVNSTISNKVYVSTVQSVNVLSSAVANGSCGSFSYKNVPSHSRTNNTVGTIQSVNDSSVVKNSHHVPTNNSTCTVQSVNMVSSTVTSSPRASFPSQNVPFHSPSVSSDLPVNTDHTVTGPFANGSPNSFPLRNMQLGNSDINCSAFPPVDVTQVVETLKTMLKNRSFTDEALTDINRSLSTLESHGVLDLCLRIYINQHVNDTSILNEESPGRPCDLAPHLYQPRRMDSQSMFIYDSDMHVMSPNFTGASDRLQSIFQSAWNPSEFGVEPGFYPTESPPISTTCLFNPCLGQSAAMNSFCIPSSEATSSVAQRFDSFSSFSPGTTKRMN